MKISKGFLLLLTGCIFSTSHAATYTVTNTSNTGAGSLRQAITDANGAAGNTIIFNISGAAPHTITVTSVLPTVDDDNMTIDGSTQPLNGGSGECKIILDGGNSVSTGFQLNTVKDGLKIYGIHIKRFTDYGIRAEGGTITIGGTGSNKRVVVSSCGNAATDKALYLKTPTIVNTFIGTDETGNTAAGNTGIGIYVVSAGLITIGTSAAASRCVISNNSSHGIYLEDGDNSVIKNCYIGVNYSGTADFGNGGSGIYLLNSNTDVAIGGTTAGEGNIISGNTSHGIYGDADVDGALIYGNKIGTGVNGTEDIGNGGYGIYLTASSSSGNKIGGTSAGMPNIIIYNGLAGVGIDAEGGITTDNNSIRRNSMYCNARTGNDLGIDLMNNGNDGMATPVITSANGSTVSGTSVASATIEVFNADNTSPCGCQGWTYKATTTANGSGSWSVTCASCFSDDVTATATDGSSNTSEFSACQTTGVLPVELLLFSARKAGASVSLNWSTASEVNNDYFVIERTSNGKLYEEAATVKGAGNSSSVLHYSFSDENPFPGISYYRLKQVDFDGAYKHSHVVAVNRNAEIEFSVFPNPAEEDNLNVFVSIPGSGVSVLTVYNQLGMIVYQETLSNTDDGMMKKLSTPSPLQKGIYFVELSTEATSDRKKILIK